MSDYLAQLVTRALLRAPQVQPLIGSKFAAGRELAETSPWPEGTVEKTVDERGAATKDVTRLPVRQANLHGEQSATPGSSRAPSAALQQLAFPINQPGNHLGNDPGNDPGNHSPSEMRSTTQSTPAAPGILNNSQSARDGGAANRNGGAVSRDGGTANRDGGAANQNSSEADKGPGLANKNPGSEPRDLRAANQERSHPLQTFSESPRPLAPLWSDGQGDGSRDGTSSSPHRSRERDRGQAALLPRAFSASNRDPDAVKKDSGAVNQEPGANPRSPIANRSLSAASAAPEPTQDALLELPRQETEQRRILQERPPSEVDRALRFTPATERAASAFHAAQVDPPAPVPTRPDPRSTPAAPAPASIRVHIGRIDLRTSGPTAAPARPTPPPRSGGPQLSLTDYLRRQRGT